jgi:Undecaprenyl-phosphate glucose phosphotransferase
VIHNNHRYLSATQALLDGVTLFATLALTFVIRFHPLLHNPELSYISLEKHLNGFLLVIPLYWITYYLTGLYAFWQIDMRRHQKRKILLSNILVAAIFLSILFVFKEINYSRRLIALFVLVSTITISLERWLSSFLIQKVVLSLGHTRKFVVIGAGSLGEKFAEKMNNTPSLGCKVVAFLDDNLVGKEICTVPVKGKVSDLSKVVEETMAEEVVVALPLSTYSRLPSIVAECDLLGVNTQIIPAYQKFLPATPHMDHLDDIPLIGVRHMPLDSPISAILKRWFDILFSIAVLIFASPLLFLIAIAVKLSSNGPIFHTQERVGLNRTTFSIYKFRSMRVQNVEQSDSEWTTKDDPRKTRIGSFLRRTSLDELPQFFNVLKGDMSVVGPRPERPHFVKQYQLEIPKYMVKHLVRPGISGWAQVNGWRGDTSIKKRIEHDIYYIENWSFVFDIKIILKTVVTGFINRNAY